MGKKNEKAPTEKPKLTPGYNVLDVLNKSAAENHSTTMADDLAGLDDNISATPKRAILRPTAASTSATAPESTPIPTPAPAPEPESEPTPAPAPLPAITEATPDPVALEQPSPVVAIAEQDNTIVVPPAADKESGFDWLWKSGAEPRTNLYRVSNSNKDFLLMLAQISPSPTAPTTLLDNIVTEFRNKHQEEFTKLLTTYYKNQLKKVR